MNTATHTYPEAATHSLFHTYLAGRACRLYQRTEHRQRSAGVVIKLLLLPFRGEGCSNVSLYSIRAVCCGNLHLAAQAAELVLKEHLFTSIETQYHLHLLALCPQLFCQVVERRYAYPAPYQQRVFSCFVKIVAVAQTGEYIQRGTRLQLRHRACSVAYHLIYKGQHITLHIAYRDRSAQELPGYDYIHKLPCPNTVGRPAQPHLIDAPGNHLIGEQNKYSSLHVNY